MHGPQVCENDVYTLQTWLGYAGALGVPLHWSVKSDSRAVCLRFGPDTAGSSGGGAPWSHPVETASPGGLDRHVAIPVLPPAPAETAKPGTTLA